jgi:uncharacterized membrane-anchored protein YhcB (DUF1043 family)
MVVQMRVWQTASPALVLGLMVGMIMVLLLLPVVWKRL